MSDTTLHPIDYQLAPVPGVEPYRGYELRWTGRDERAFFAVGHGETVLLQLSRHFFTPTQTRWQWLVDNGFPHGTRYPATGIHGPLNDEVIDAAIRGERRAA